MTTKRGLDAGTRVWVIYLVLEDRSRTPKPVPRARIQERVFQNVILPHGNYSERWALGPVGDGYVMAFAPDKVYLTREAAKAALVSRIDAMISQLQTLKATV